MIVEHVHVHAGGQAIVGAVATPGEGMRRNQRNNPCKAASVTGDGGGDQAATEFAQLIRAMKTLAAENG